MEYAATEDVAHLISNPSYYDVATEDVVPHPISNSSYYETQASSVEECVVVVTEDVVVVVVHHPVSSKLTEINATTRHDYEKVE